MGLVKMLSSTRLKRLKSGLLAGIMLLTMMLPRIPIAAQEADSFPYTMFAGSSEAGAITVDAGNFCVNGNIASNGTIVTKGNVNINGTRTERSEEHTSELQSRPHLVCRLLLEKKKNKK